MMMMMMMMMITYFTVCSFPAIYTFTCIALHCIYTSWVLRTIIGVVVFTFIYHCCKNRTNIKFIIFIMHVVGKNNASYHRREPNITQCSHEVDNLERWKISMQPLITLYSLFVTDVNIFNLFYLCKCKVFKTFFNYLLWGHTYIICALNLHTVSHVSSIINSFLHLPWITKKLNSIFAEAYQMQFSII